MASSMSANESSNKFPFWQEFFAKYQNQKVTWIGTFFNYFFASHI